MDTQRRPNTGFAFGMFETQSGFAVSHQYDRSLATIRPGDPATLRVDAVTAYVTDGSGPHDPRTIHETGWAVPFEKSLDRWSGLFVGSPNGLIQHYDILKSARADST